MSINVNIGNNIFLFTPDTSTWRHSAGELFTTTPVLIGNHPCFIKRYGAQALFTGKDFLLQIKGLSLSGLPQIYDVQSAIETEGQVWYIFQEWLEGDILESKIKKSPVGFYLDPRKLVNHLLSALNSIHQYGYWFADFCNKNIFVTNDGQFMLIDLDSCKPFDNRVPISEILSSFVQNYIIEVLKYSEIRIKDIEAIDINLLQLTMFVCKLKYFAEHADKQYREDDLEIIHDTIFQTKKSYVDMIFNYALKNPNPLRASLISTLTHQLFKEVDKVYALRWLTPPPVIRATLKNAPQNALIRFNEMVFFEWSIDHYSNAVLNHGTSSEPIEQTGRKAFQFVTEGHFSIIAKHAQWGQTTQSVYKLNYSIIYPKPVISNFSANNATNIRVFDEGELTLRWSTIDAQSVEIDVKTGDTLLQSLTGERVGTVHVKVTQTCKITLTAIGTVNKQQFTTKKTVQIEVVPLKPVIKKWVIQERYPTGSALYSIEEENTYYVVWEVENANSVTIDNVLQKNKGYQAVVATGRTRTFTLTAINSCYGETATINKAFTIRITPIPVPQIKRFSIKNSKGIAIDAKTPVKTDEMLSIDWDVADAKEVNLWLRKDSGDSQLIPIKMAPNNNTFLVDKQYAGKTHQLFLIAKNSKHQSESAPVMLKVKANGWCGMISFLVLIVGVVFFATLW